MGKSVTDRYRRTVSEEIAQTPTVALEAIVGEFDREVRQLQSRLALVRRELRRRYRAGVQKGQK